MDGQILIVDDARAEAQLYRAYLLKAGHQCDVADDGASALTQLTHSKPNVLLLDLHLPDTTGLALLEKIKQLQPTCHVIIITASDEIQLAVHCMRAGAFDYLTKPIPRDRLLITVANAMKHALLSALVNKLSATNERQEYHGMVGKSSAMQAVYQTIEHAAHSRAAAFIIGASGTGKELCAQALHLAGPRKHKAYVTLNCAALPGELLESELFGHMKGAFTGANQDRSGAAQRANGGSLFLDEITELDIELQSKLLRFLQTGEVQRLGSDDVERVDVRFICASNRDPWQAVQEGRLREDLYYRLMVIPIELPALRERRDDILPLAYHFLKRINHEESKQFTGFSQDACELMLKYDWPGNVRQLENGLRRVVVLNQGELISARMVKSVLNAKHAPKAMGRLTPTDMAQHTLPADVDQQQQALNTQAHLQQLKQELTHSARTNVARNDFNGRRFIPQRLGDIKPLHVLEREIIEAVLRLHEGNITKAAEALGINPSTIHRKRREWQNDSASHHG